LVIASCVVGSAGNVRAESAAPPKELAGLGERWESAMRDIGVPGMAVVVVRGNDVIYTEALGLRDPEKELPVTPDTMFYIASCTKSYTAMGLLTLVEDGKVDLDGPVKKHLPRLELSDAALTAALTSRDLLSHAKGIDSDPIVTLDAYTGEITEDRFYYWLRQAGIKGSFQYSNVHYTLAGRLIEAVTGKPWRDYLEERIFKPAGMLRTTGYASRMYGDSDCAIPSAMKDGKFVLAATRKTDKVMHAAGGLGASIHDLGRWLRVNLNGGEIDGKRIVSRETIVQMQTTQVRGESRSRLAGRTREGYGLGWFAGAYQGRRVLDHGGGYEGTSASVSFLPVERIGVAVVANAGGPLPELVAIDVYNRLLGIDAPDALPSVREQAAQRRAREKDESSKPGPNPTVGEGLSLAPQAYVGTYVNPDWGTLVIQLVDGELRGRLGELSVRLVSTGKNQFELVTGIGDPDPARFHVDGEAVQAVVVKIPGRGGGDAEFQRR
jgi:CubicO group peptidase (beta-lactamase class C family)